MKTLYQQRQLGNMRGNPLRDYHARQDEARPKTSLIPSEREVYESKLLNVLEQIQTDIPQIGQQISPLIR